MRLSQPTRATQLKIQVSSAWPETWLWLNTMCFFGSMPLARNAAVTSRVLRASSAGPPQTSTPCVIACMSTTQYTQLCVCCSFTKLTIAPR